MAQKDGKDGMRKSPALAVQSPSKPRDLPQGSTKPPLRKRSVSKTDDVQDNDRPLDLSEALTRHAALKKLEQIASAKRADPNDVAHALLVGRNMLPASEEELIAEAGALLARDDISLGRGDAKAFAPPDLSAPAGRGRKDLIVQDLSSPNDGQTVSKIIAAQTLDTISPKDGRPKDGQSDVQDLSSPRNGQAPRGGQEYNRSDTRITAQTLMTTRPDAEVNGSISPEAAAAAVQDTHSYGGQAGGGMTELASTIPAPDQIRSSKKSRQGVQHRITPETRMFVKYWAFAGHAHEVIAAALGISRPTLLEHYRYELDYGAQELTARLAHRLVSIALHGQGKEAVTALIFLLKAKGGFREEPQRVDVDVNVSGSIQHEHYALTHEERANRLLQIIAAGQAAGAGSTYTVESKRVASEPGDADGRLPLPS